VIDGGLARYVVEKRYRRGDGSYLWLSLSISPARDPDGTPYLVAVAEDIDARKRAELALGSLTVREMGVLMLLARDGSNPQISAELKIGLGTVKHHVANVLEKLGVENRTGVVVRVAELGLFRTDRTLKRTVNPTDTSRRERPPPTPSRPVGAAVGDGARGTRGLRAPGIGRP
jgi:DNA-binding CsgD family transcriptional regulator